MNKSITCLLSAAILCSCSGNRQKSEKPVLVAPAIDTLVVNDTTKKIRVLEDDLKKLAAVPDSFSAYIRLNYTLYDSVTKWQGEKKGLKYLDTIILHHTKAEKDTALRAILSKAYFWSAYAYYSDSYSDSLVTGLEKFLLFDDKYNASPNYKIYVYNYLGIQYHKLGDIKKAGYYYNLYRESGIKEGNNDRVASSTIDIAISLNEQQYYDSSIRLINEVMPKKGIRAKRKPGLYSNLIRAYAGKRLYADATRSFENGLAFIRTTFASGELDSSDYFDGEYELRWIMADIQTSQGNYKDAFNNFTEALRCLSIKSEGNLQTREAGKLFLSLGRWYEKTDDLKKALQYYQKALSCVTKVDSSNIFQIPSMNELYPENTIMESLDSKAGMLTKIFDSTRDAAMLEQAVQCYEVAFAVENKLLQGFSYDESIMRQSKESKLRSEKAIAACHQLYTITHSTVWAEKAFVFAEKSKAIALQESVKRNIAASNTVQQDTNWQQVQHYQQQVNYYEKEIAITNDTLQTIKAALASELSKAENNLLLARSALLHSNSSYREALLKTDSLSAGMVNNKLLDKNTSLVEYFAGDKATYIFQLRSGAAISFAEADSSLRTDAEQFLSFFSDRNRINNEPASYQQIALRLYTRLFPAGISPYASASLVIVPDGLLNLVPFEALVTKAGGSLNPQQFSYLLLQKQICYGYSSSTLLKQSENTVPNAAQPISCFAPVFAAGERGNTPLLFSQQELEAIRNEEPAGKYYLEKNASISNFRSSILSSNIMHIASHAHADTSSTLPAIEFFDSTLYVSEIYAMHISPHLVVLSACETGIGKIDKSEGAMSLARAFYYAGAKNIITSLWSVDDKSTATLFSRFYSGIENNDYSQSLYKAKLEYIKNASNSTASPYYWAGFVHIGYTKEKRQGLVLPLWLIITASLILLMSLFYFFRNRK